MSEPQQPLLPIQTVFYGGWTVSTLSPIEDWDRWQLRFKGTDQELGDIPLINYEPFAAYVSGRRWTLTVLTYFYEPSPGYYPSNPLRLARRAGPGGALQVTVEGISISDTVPIPPPLVLDCLHDDPNPPPLPVAPLPWDFNLDGYEPIGTPE